MDDQKRTEIKELGEFGLIDRIRKTAEQANVLDSHKSTYQSIDDDGAVLDAQGRLVVMSSDMLTEGIHFDLTYFPLKHLGYKSVVVNLSDIYAMNAIPEQVIVNIGLSNRFSVEAVDELYAGIIKACKFYNVDMVGGDTTSSRSGLILSLSAVGYGSAETLVYRSGAKVGDLVCVTGDLGAAYIGLQVLEREKEVYLTAPTMEPELEQYQYMIERFLKPEARRDQIIALQKAGVKPTAMMDVSDGLASELHHICKSSGVGAYIEESGVPISVETQQKIIDFQLDPITVALSGGEDYELLFTIDPSDIDKVKFLPDIYIAGEIVPKEDGIKLHTKGGNIHPITAQGWVHF